MKQAKIYMYSNFAGILTEDENGYRFIYNPEYLLSKDAEPISLTMPLTDKPYISNILHPFFDGLIPEGWLLDIVEKNWKIDNRDRMSLLLACCKDCIGAVSVQSILIHNYGKMFILLSAIRTTRNRLSFAMFKKNIRYSYTSPSSL